MKYILLMAITVLIASADMAKTTPVQEFDTFLQTALKNSPYLHSLSVDIEKASQEGTLLQRYKNPNLELEVSQFSPDIGTSQNGERIAFSQPIRLWGVANTKKRLANAIGESAINSYVQKRAAFIKNISLLYVEYAQQKKFLNLAHETSQIAKSIYDISSARYEAGTISRGEMLQAKIAYDTVVIEYDSFKLNVENSLSQIMQYSGMTETIMLEDNHTFKVLNLSDKKNPNIAKLRATQKEALANASVSSNKIEWLNLYAEYENAPNQDITRVGVNIPLAIFNTRSQEKQIALLEAQKSDLLLSNETKKVSMELKRLQNERTSLKVMASKYKKLITSQMQLLEMFQKAYKIANINLLALQDVKNKVIQTKKALINISIASNKNAILTNYIQGNYNE